VNERKVSVVVLGIEEELGNNGPYSSEASPKKTFVLAETGNAVLSLPLVDGGGAPKAFIICTSRLLNYYQKYDSNLMVY